MYNLYVGNKMTGVPYFNAPWFDETAQHLRTIPSVYRVFNPAEHDREMGLDPMLCPTGSQSEVIAAGGLPLRSVLGADWAWIAEHSNGMIVGPDWPRSMGAKSEVACHQALGLPVWEFAVFACNWASPELESMTIPPLMPGWPFAPAIMGTGEEDDGLVCDCLD